MELAERATQAAALLRDQLNLFPPDTARRASDEVLAYAQRFGELPCWVGLFPDGSIEGHDNPFDIRDIDSAAIAVEVPQP